MRLSSLASETERVAESFQALQGMRRESGRKAVAEWEALQVRRAEERKFVPFQEGEECARLGGAAGRGTNGNPREQLMAC